MDSHIVRAFDRDLEALQALIMKMGGVVEDAINRRAEICASRPPSIFG